MSKKNGHYVTYTPGDHFKYHNKMSPITKKKIMLICDELSSRFGGGCKFLPEPITEGGIEMVDWRDKKPKEYKTIRLHGIGKWPWVVHETVENDWKNSDDVISDYPVEIHTWLKAFDGAPCWTNHELNIIREVFEDYGFSLCKKRRKS
jgi:hypothetical protein